MAYNIIVTLRAQQEIEDAIDYYAQQSTDAPLTFISSLRDTYDTLSTNPFFAVRYKNVRAVRIRRFPYMLYFIVSEAKNTVRVPACFHGKRNPDRRPRA